MLRKLEAWRKSLKLPAAEQSKNAARLVQSGKVTAVNCRRAVVHPARICMVNKRKPVKRGPPKVRADQVARCAKKRAQPTSATQTDVQTTPRTKAHRCENDENEMAAKRDEGTTRKAIRRQREDVEEKTIAAEEIDAESKPKARRTRKEAEAPECNQRKHRVKQLVASTALALVSSQRASNPRSGSASGSAPRDSAAKAGQVPDRAAATSVPPASPPPQHHTTESSSSRRIGICADAASEIARILRAASPEELLGVEPSADEETVNRAWKQLVLLLHPDKLHKLDEETRHFGADALNQVHAAKEELKRRAQEMSAEVPDDPEAAGPPRCVASSPGARKFEISWKLQEAQDPARPVEKYEIWGPRHFSEAGEPFDWVLLATVPPLQSHFVLVEEAPTQQDVMWAGDRALLPVLPLTVHAVNGKGPSNPLTFELPWSNFFPWLKGSPSALCPQCLHLMPLRGNGWTKCGSCGFTVQPQSSVIIRCRQCHGEVLWGKAGALTCTCCHTKMGQAPPESQQWKPSQPRSVPPQHAKYQERTWNQHTNNQQRNWNRGRQY